MTTEYQGTEELVIDRKAELVERAKDLGIKNPHTMSEKTLEKKIDEKMAPKAEEKPLSELAQKQKIQKEARRLVRVHIQNVNPDDKGKTHTLVKVSNRFIGTIHRAVPNMTEPDKGTHLEVALLDTLKDQQFLYKFSKKDKRTGETITGTKLMKKWLITELPPLTEAEYKALANEQRKRAMLESDED